MKLEMNATSATVRDGREARGIRRATSRPVANVAFLLTPRREADL